MRISIRQRLTAWYAAALLLGSVVKSSLLAAAGLTVNELLVPVTPEFPLAVAVIVKIPLFVIVTLIFRAPFANAGVVMGAPERAPVEVRMALNPLPL